MHFDLCRATKRPNVKGATAESGIFQAARTPPRAISANAPSANSKQLRRTKNTKNKPRAQCEKNVSNG